MILIVKTMHNVASKSEKEWKYQKCTFFLLEKCISLSENKIKINKDINIECTYECFQDSWYSLSSQCTQGESSMDDYDYNL